MLNYATIINNETIHLTQQVERVLQMAKSGKDVVQLNRESFQLSPLLHDMIEKTYKPLIRSRGGNIHIECDETIEVYADKLHFKNVISNLLDNSIKYCKKAPQVSLECKTENKGIKISIIDNGIGISKENLKNIFNRFYRVPTGNLHDVKGFGLGLNYVKLICKLHHGEVTVSSELEKGSTFTLFFPHKN
jgi:Signal transduction histidine kinase